MGIAHKRPATLTARGQVGREVVSGLTSRAAAAATPERLPAIAPTQWQIESGLHHRRDARTQCVLGTGVTMDEDATRMKSWSAARALARLNLLVLALVARTGRLRKPAKGPTLRCNASSACQPQNAKALRALELAPWLTASPRSV